jgi:hypothetical protein
VHGHATAGLLYMTGGRTQVNMVVPDVEVSGQAPHA